MGADQIDPYNRFVSFSLSGKAKKMNFGLKCVLLALSLPAVLGLGSCPSPAVKEDLDLLPYLGTWHEIERNYNPYESSKRTCAKTNIQQVNVKSCSVSCTTYNVMFNSTWEFNGKTDDLITYG